jgi:hypothetical protein
MTTVYLIAGPAGSGKTRLAQDLRAVRVEPGHDKDMWQALPEALDKARKVKGPHCVTVEFWGVEAALRFGEAVKAWDNVQTVLLDLTPRDQEGLFCRRIRENGKRCNNLLPIYCVHHKTSGADEPQAPPDRTDDLRRQVEVDASRVRTHLRGSIRQAVEKYGHNPDALKVEVDKVLHTMVQDADGKPILDSRVTGVRQTPDGAITIDMEVPRAWAERMGLSGVAANGARSMGCSVQVNPAPKKEP